eukprot:c22089_g1_i1 orf=736-2061(-)
MFGSGTTPGLFGSSPSPSAFGSGSSPLIFGASSAPAFGATSTSAFGISSTPIFGASSMPSVFGVSSTPSLFGSSSTPAFGASSSPSIFGASSSSSMFGASTSPGLFGSSSTPSLFGTPPQSGGLFGSVSQLSFGQATPFGQTQASLFGQPQQQQPSPFGSPLGSPFGQPQTPLFGQTQAQTPTFGGMQPSIFGQSTSAFGQVQPTVLGTPQQPFFTGNQLVTQMAPVAPMSIPLPDREVQAIVDAYKDDPGNPRYGFRHLLLSVTDASMHVKPLGVSDIMWAEAMNKLEGMDTKDRERLWPELVQGFKDLSRRLKLQDEALAADAQRLQATESNVKLLRRHFEIDTLPWIQRLRQKEQELQRRLLKAMRIVEALEGKGFRLPLTKGETKLGERLRTLSRQVLRQQTEAITRLVNVLKRDMRDLEIMIPENVDMPNGHVTTY